MKSIVARWTDWAGGGLEHLVLRLAEGAITADGVVASGGDHPFAARYRVVCDARWRVRQVEVQVVGEERRLLLNADGHGAWVDGAGTHLPELAGAIDIDLSISPFTNTLPIRRLDLEPGQPVDIVTAYIQVPELAVSADPQRYTCLERRARYRYESRDTDFRRDLETDPDGLVVSYPGLFRRVF